jgi:DNA repair protein RecO (recombination protein O)
MEWTDEGIVIGVRRHGEASAILELLTRDHGRHLGLVRGGAGSRMRPILQPGNSLRAVWRARLDEHLGNYAVEGLRLRAAEFLGVSFAVYGVTHLCALARLLPERDPHPDILDALEAMFDRMSDPRAIAAHAVRFELQLLTELGFGLDLSSCAATGQENDLAYVSPKSGRAVSREAGAPWRDKLLRLPSFVPADGVFEPPASGDIADGFALTGFFLTRNVLAPRGIEFSPAREPFVAAVLRGDPTPAASAEPVR